MINAAPAAVNIGYLSFQPKHRYTSFSYKPLYYFAYNKKAFQSSLLWKAFNTQNIAFSGQLHFLTHNYDNDVTHNRFGADRRYRP